MPHCPFHSQQTPSPPLQVTCVLSSSVPLCPQSGFLWRHPDSRPHVMSEIICYTTLQNRALLNGQLGSYLVFKLIAKRFNRLNWNKAVKIKRHLWASGHLASLCLNLELDRDTATRLFFSWAEYTTAGPKKALSTYEFVDGPGHGPWLKLSHRYENYKGLNARQGNFKSLTWKKNKCT